jgi:uncharacterized SAM-binding protein YcdF (DUF218 family)
MFDLLTRALLWLLVGIGLWYLFNSIIPKNYLTWLGGFVLLAAIFLAFQDPNDRLISTVWSILSFPLRPLGLAIVLLISAAKRKAWKDIAAREATIALVVLLVCSIPIIPLALSSQLETSIVTELDPSEVVVFQGDTLPVVGIVTLGTRATVSGRDSVVPLRFISSEDRLGAPLRQRLLHTAEIYNSVFQQLGTLSPVIVSGLLSEAEDQAIREYLTRVGVRSEDITVDRDGVSIFRSATRSNDLLAERGESGVVLLVAPSLTLRRATATFARLYRRENRLVRPVPTDLVQFQAPEGRIPIRVTDLLPSVEALALTTYIIDEYLTSIYYFLRGWAPLDYPLDYSNCCVF